MKKVFLSLPVLFLFIPLFGQKKLPSKGFKEKNDFTVGSIAGGSLNYGFGNQYAHFGFTPYLGVSLNKYVDIAGSFGVNFITNTSSNGISIDSRRTSFGPGAFVRLFPVKYFYLQGQYEYNFIQQSSNVGGINVTNNQDANSFLMGAGFSTGKTSRKPSYFYLSVLWDVADDSHSPYKDNQDNAVPIIRAGFNVSLQPTRKKQPINRFTNQPVIRIDKVRHRGRWHRRRW